MRAIRVNQVGGPEKLQLDEVPLPEPKAGEIRLKVAAARVNFIDTYQRSGLYPLPLPLTLGLEVAGTVTALGAGVTTFKVGDPVASARATGGYAEEALAPAAQTVHLPPHLDLQQAAALLLQGLTAHYLACDTFPLKPGDTALVHAAAGGSACCSCKSPRCAGPASLAPPAARTKPARAGGGGGRGYPLQPAGLCRRRAQIHQRQRGGRGL